MTVLFLGYLNQYPDHWTQGSNLDDLKDHLLDLYKLFSQDQIVGIKKVEDNGFPNLFGKQNLIAIS